MSEPASRYARPIALAVGVGAVAGLAALALQLALHFGSELVIGRFTDLGGPAVLELRWALLLLPAAGGLLSGVVVQQIAGESFGHGTDQMVHAFHRQDGHFSLRAPAVKATAAVAVISFGGSAGPEGPIAALGAAIGSKCSRIFGGSARDRRILLVAGCAAGVGALFGCPLGGALFATSILYQRPEFEGSALVSAFVASAVSYSVFVTLGGSGAHVLADTEGLAYSGVAELPVYLALGLSCALVAMFFAASLRGVESGFARLGWMPAWSKPALGGLLTGALACLLPQVMDGQYVFVQNAFDGLIFVGMGANPRPDWLVWAGLLALIALAKCVATSFTVGSGGAGGVLGPSVFIGGIVGAALGALVEGLQPGFLPVEVRRALIPVGMAGVLSAAMRTPLAAMVIVMEMTGSFGLIVPLMIVSMSAYLVGGRVGLVRGQVPTAADSPAHAGDAVVQLLERTRVDQCMDRDMALSVERGTPLESLIRSLREGAPGDVPVVDRGKLVGRIALAELHQHVDDAHLASVVVADDVMQVRPFALHPADDLYSAVAAFQERALEAIPVVGTEGAARGVLLGVLTRAHVHARVEEFFAHGREQLLREHEGLAALAEEGRAARLLDPLALPEHGRIQRLRVAADLAGKSLSELDFRRSRGAEVLAIQTAAGGFLCPPDPRRPLAPDDVLLLLSSTAPESG